MGRPGVFVGLLGLVAALDACGLAVVALSWRKVAHGGVWGATLFSANFVAALGLGAFRIQLQFKRIES